MSSISYDGRSFLIDGRRIWVVSGAIHYPRVPRELWRDRIRAARQCGLNTIETFVFWNLHEPEPGRFDFEGDLDLRQFVQTIGEEGMYCILRPGPFIRGEWDLGGLPSWLLKQEDIRLREAHPAFLEATARYIGALMANIGDLQVTTAVGSVAVTGAGGGPIIMIQAENEYFCDNPEQTTGYLGELVRYLRENGCSVPINDSNNLWAHVEGTIACWNSRHDLPASLRQLRVVQPNAPRLVTEYMPGRFDHWDGERDRRVTADDHLANLAGILAVGGQYNLYPFHGGTNFGFTGGRSVTDRAAYITTSFDCDAPLGEGGVRGDKYAATKRISVFANQFGYVLANLQPDVQHAAVVPDNGERPLSVLHQHGSQGDIVFLFKGTKDNTRQTTLLLPNGLKLPVTLGDDRVAWLGLDLNLAGTALLTFTNLRPWAFVNKKLLVLFGPPGSDGIVCINDATWHLAVPGGRTPLVEQHEGITLAILNTEQIDTAYVTGAGIVVGADGLNLDDTPRGLAGWKTTTIQADGAVESANLMPPKAGRAPTLTDWHMAELREHLDGSSETFETITGPTSLEALDVPFGYGWYRIAGRIGQAGSVLFPHAGDRLHLYRDGKFETVLGEGPGAEPEPTSVKLNDAVILADNLGRFDAGWRFGQRKGIFGHGYGVRRVRLAKPKVVDAPGPDLFAAGGYVHGARRSHRPPSQALVWQIKPTGRGGAMMLELSDLPGRCAVLLNDEAVGIYDQQLSGRLARFVLEAPLLKGGRNELRLAFVGRVERLTGIGAHVLLYQATSVTAKSEWAFAPWEPPGPARFTPLPRSLGKPEPRWFRSRFEVSHRDVPLWLKPIGLTKGQIYLNSRNVGRYFVATHTGKAVGPQQKYYLPEPWLSTAEPNELLLFDEHGKSPNKCRLVYDAGGPYG